MKRIVLVGGMLLACAMLAVAGGAKEAPAAAKPAAGPQKLVVWCHAVHQQVAEGKRGVAGGNIAAEFEAKFNAKIEWVPIAWGGMQDKILRQLSLSSGEADLVFVVESWASATTLNMFETLNERMQKDPIEDQTDIPEGSWRIFLTDGKQKAMPYRTAPQILHYNKDIYQKRGIAGPPATLEEFAEQAVKATYVREDGARVYGLSLKSDEDTIAFIRAFGGEVLTKDFKIKCNEPEAVRAISLLRDLFKAGAIPPNFMQLGAPDFQKLMSEGLIAAMFHGDNYYFLFNDPAKSKVAGKMWFAEIPPSKTAPFKIAPAKIAVWAAGIPVNSPAANKELAYKFLKFFAGKQPQLQMAINGNGPIRTSTFAEAAYKKDIPYADVTSRMLAVSSPHLPAFEGTTEVFDAFKEQAVQAITGKKEVQKAMDDAAAAIKGILAREGIKK